MPLYKRKIISQKTFENKVSNETLERNVFKTPLIINDIKLNENPTAKLSQKPPRKEKSSLAEYSLNLHGFGEDNVQNKSEKNKLCELKKNQSTVKNKIRKENIELNIFKEAKKERNNSKSSKAEKINLNVDLNNNISKNKPIKRKDEAAITEKLPAKKKKHAKDLDTSSELDEMVKSLWSQEKIPSNEPPENFSHHERLVWLQQERNVGLYVCCDKCDKYRYLKDTVDPLELPDKWYCYMNLDKKHNKCSDPEVEIKSWEEADMIYNTYHAGSIVWARLDGYPWWPAMVDDDPDTEMYYWLDEYSCVPTYYHVVFFDSKTVSRAWLKPNALCKFKGNENNPLHQTAKRNMFRSRVDVAKSQAKEASNLTVAKRLKEYSFLARWPGVVNSPIDPSDAKKAKKNYKNGSSQRKSNKRKLSKNDFAKSPPSKKVNDKDVINDSFEATYMSPDLFDRDERILNEVLSLEDTTFNSFDDL